MLASRGRVTRLSGSLGAGPAMDRGTDVMTGYLTGAPPVSPALGQVVNRLCVIQRSQPQGEFHDPTRFIKTLRPKGHLWSHVSIEWKAQLTN